MATSTTTTSSSGAAAAACRRPLLQDWFTAGAESNDGSAAAATWDRILLLDGGVSTHLAAKINNDNGTNKNTGAVVAFAHKELWSSSLLLTEPGRQTILQGHLDWLQIAGVNLISTVTYQCHYHEETWPANAVIANENDMNKLWKHGIQLAAKALEQYSSSSSSSSSSTSQRPTFLVASSGCYGAALANGAEYTGDYGPNITMQDLMQFHRRKLQQIIMASASSDDETVVDCIAIETVPSVLELKALVQLLSEPETIKLFKQQQHNNVTCWISLACGDGECLYDQTPLIQALQVLQTLPVNIVPAIGLNCCDYRHLSSLANILVTFIANEHQQQHVDGSSTSRALVLYPNSGEEWDGVAKVFRPKRTTTTNTTTEETTEPTLFVDCLMDVIETVETTWREKTKSTTLPYPRIIVGGCCRTTPTEIAALRVAVDKHLESEKKASGYTLQV